METAADAEPMADAGAGAGAKTRVAGELPYSSPRAFSASLCGCFLGLSAGSALCCVGCPILSPSCWVGSRGVGRWVGRVGLLGFGLGLGPELVRSAGRGRSGMSFQFGVGGWLSGV